jgi:CDP-diacylglycerol---serine O-phosphatidyltransferase
MADIRNIRISKAIVPNAITLAAIFAGYVSIIESFQGHYLNAAVLIVIACLLDMLDGRVARMMKVASDFGVQIDSLADVINYGVAPAILFYFLYFQPWGIIGLALGFLIMACAAVRLARFNVGADPDIPQAYFVGLPTTIAAFVLSGWVIFTFSQTPVLGTSEIAAVLVVLLSVLMVSEVHYDKSNIFSLRYIRKTNRIITLLGIFISVILYPQLAFFGWGLLYILYGLVRSAIITLWYLRRDDGREE